MSVGLERQIELIRVQAQACEQLGSPLYAVLLDRLAGDVAAGGVGARILAGHEEDPGPSALALRLMAAVHRLVLTGRAPALAAHYPSTGGDGDAAAAWPAFREVLEDHTEEVRAGLASPPQTNEVGRSAALWGGLLRILAASDRPDLPVRLVEIGASGGLNLLADQFTYRATDGGDWRGGDSQGGASQSRDVRAGHGTGVVLDPAWETRPPGIPELVEVVDRLGCDLSPIAADTEEGALSLLSCVWPDQTHRLERLRGALGLARRHPVEVVRSGGGDFLDGVELVDGQHTVVWHSVMWQYVPVEERQRMLDRLQELGAGAASVRPLTHLAFEPRRLQPGGPHRFVVAATTWPGGGERLLGEAPPHGVPVRWGAPQQTETA
ncbi:DUF2332 domain-containing protein [Ornithinimicrobium ciconiae]|uniref:DUF2332 domain-containing protein n=1 Tax=Ornithinimicrobium ciconiae TaxID=2594265 RepID=A0A516GE46_9MICO|nr:DUF2332 domain-containing protein [Ornithinimicrobium ciconiae]QDO89768.1 DUF2332 domain-containing protein [Ornithinimicrobium ciconiae]